VIVRDTVTRLVMALREHTLGHALGAMRAD
jgi:hypothetical protein